MARKVKRRLGRPPALDPKTYRAIHLRIDAPIFAEVSILADHDRRTITQMVCVLLDEALAVRRSTGAQRKAA